MTVPALRAFARHDRWPVAVWRFRRWRAGHYLWRADLIYRRRPNPFNRAARERAADLCREIDAARP